jgi:YD repeat-containing protein
VQTTTAGGTNYVAATVGTNISATAHDPTSITAETVTYTYDAKGRLTKVARSGSINNNVQTQYSYDKANNRKTVVTTGSGNVAPPP